MPNKRFLSPPAPGADYPAGSENNFLGANRDFLATIANTMGAGEPKTAPRRPTPFSVLWQFASDLEGKSGSTLKTAARRRLRGILALLALRSREGIVLSLHVSPPFDQVSNGIPIVDMFRRHISQRAETILKDKRLIYLKLGDQVVAGYSPSTLFFPAAKRLELSPNSCPTWFSQEHGEWLDPTDAAEQISGSEVKIDKNSIPQNAGAIRTWLDAVLLWINQNHATLNNVLPNQNLLLQELSVWRTELEGYEAVGSILDSPIQTPESTNEIANFISALRPVSLTIEGKPVNGQTLHKGFYLLSKTLLGDAATTLYGRIAGASRFAASWANSPTTGLHLGDALGLPPTEKDALAIPFLFVDKLFTPALARLSDSLFSIDSRWRSLVCKNEVFAYPISVEALKYFSLQEIESSLSIEKGIMDDQYTVRFKLNNFCFEKIYVISSQSGAPVETLDPSLDFRLFPDYDLCSLANPEKQIPAKEDQCYYARIRLSKALFDIKSNIVPIFEGHDVANLADNTEFDSKAIGSLDGASTNDYGSGSRLVLEIRPGKNRLGGVDFAGKGLILLRLDKAQSVVGNDPQSATVGIDFGTSNTCLSTLVGYGNSRILLPSSTTTTFLKGFTPAARDRSHEGYAADFDFFPIGSGNEARLFGGSFFPTQLASRNLFQADDYVAIQDNAFNPQRALVCFESVSDFFLKGTTKVNSVANYVSELNREEAFVPSVHLKDRLKWDAENSTDTDFFKKLRRIFLQHLRLQLIHSTAKSGAWIANVRASYPRAFTNSQKGFFKIALSGIWKPNGAIVPTLEIYTESCAAAAYLATEQNIDHFLIDIGGGTTDICVFSDNQMKLESSVRIAADVVDRYFLAAGSKILREKLVEAYCNCDEDSKNNDLKTALKYSFPEATSSDRDFEGAMVPRGLFYTLLGLSKAMGPDKENLFYQSLSEAVVFKNKAVEQFYTTLAVFYGGLAYFSGLMLKSKVNEHQMDGRRVQISFGGNGANHLSWLLIENEKPVDTFIQKMFRAGSGLADKVDITVDILRDPKASVALGLNSIVQNDVATAGATVYDRVDGNWNNEDCVNLLNLYSKPNPIDGWEFEKSEIFGFLKALAAATPEGKIGSKKITSHLNNSWINSLVADDKTNNNLKQAVSHRLSSCKTTFKSDIELKDPGLALEPLLIAELSGLLSILRNSLPTDVQ